MHIALGLGLIAPPRPRSPMDPLSPVHFAAGIGVRLAAVAFLISSLVAMTEWFPVLVQLEEPDGRHLAMGLRFTLILALMVVSSVLMFVDPFRLAVWMVRGVKGAVRRAGAYWEAPDRVEGPDDVFARLMDREPAPRLADVEGFVMYARGTQWPMRWKRLTAWCQVARRLVDAAMRAGDERVVLGGEELDLEEASFRLGTIAGRLERGRWR